MAKKFMVIRYHKDENVSRIGDNDHQLYDDYQAAFEAFNQIVLKETWNQVKQPKGEQPLRAPVMWDELIELWVINLADELATK